MFRFRQFGIDDSMTAMKVGTDSVLLGAWALDSLTPRRILDIGTGTGIIALMLAQRFDMARITAIEIDPDAASQARFNVAQSKWCDRIDIVTGNILQYRSDDPFDAVVSNPPFFNEPLQSPDVRRAISRHESALTLGRLIGLASGLLSDGGVFAFIAPSIRLDELIYKMALARIDVEHITHVAPDDCSPPIRVLIQGRKGVAEKYQTDRLDIRCGTRYSSEYQALTHEFYLDRTFR